MKSFTYYSCILFLIIVFQIFPKVRGDYGDYDNGYYGGGNPYWNAPYSNPYYNNYGNYYPPSYNYGYGYQPSVGYYGSGCRMVGIIFRRWVCPINY
uniref:Uncharacterized protein n=1 Tax=Strongyloides venezuelensis TaxID=75913 RepID=A0A0K0FC76_STRVS